MRRFSTLLRASAVLSVVGISLSTPLVANSARAATEQDSYVDTYHEYTLNFPAFPVPITYVVG